MRKRATYEDLRALPEHMVGELIDGELWASPRPAVPHAVACTELGTGLNGRFGGGGGRGGWWILFEPELHFPPQIVVPDVAGWRHERMPTPPAAAFVSLVPDWVCEVVSPSTGRLDRIKKMPVYAHAGVAWLWMLDPLQRSLEIYRLTNGHYSFVAGHADDEVVKAAPFEELALELARLWPGPPVTPER